MSKRAKRERRERRNAEQTVNHPSTVATVRAVEKVPSRAVTASARASTFEVAAAHRRLADALPSVVHQRSKAPAMRKPAYAPVADSKPNAGQTAAKASPRSRQDASLKIDKPPQTACKAKPRRTSGDGKSRDYVPWCR